LNYTRLMTPPLEFSLARLPTLESTPLHRWRG